MMDIAMQERKGEPMSRIVDVEPLDFLAWKDGDGTTFDDGVLWVLEKIDEFPTIEQRPTGRWMVDQDGRLHCSECLENPTNRVMIDGRLVYDMTPIVGKMKFCPNCGVRMEV